MTVQQIEKIETGVVIDGSVTNSTDFAIQIVNYAINCGMKAPEGWDALRRNLEKQGDESEHLDELEYVLENSVGWLNQLEAREGFYFHIEESALRLDSHWVEVVTIGQYGHDEVIDILHNVEGVVEHGPDESSKESAVEYLKRWDYGDETDGAHIHQGDPRDDWEHGEVVSEYLLCWSDGMVGLYRKPVLDAWGVVG